MDKELLKAKTAKRDRCHNKNAYPGTGRLGDPPGVICFEGELHKHASGVLGNFRFHLQN